MKTIIWMLYTLVVVYSMLDAIQTKTLLEVGAKELNPICNWLITTTGTVYSIYYAKLATLLLLLILLYHYLHNHKELSEVKNENG